MRNALCPVLLGGGWCEGSCATASRLRLLAGWLGCQQRPASQPASHPAGPILLWRGDQPQLSFDPTVLPRTKDPTQPALRFITCQQPQCHMHQSLWLRANNFRETSRSHISIQATHKYSGQQPLSTFVH